MAPSHVQNSMQAQNQPRPGPNSKSASLRILHSARLPKKAFMQSSMPSMPGCSNDNASIIKHFRLHREVADHPTLRDISDDEHDAPRHRVSYTREQKLAAISYAQTTWKSQKDRSMKLISKYAAANNLGITTTMLRKWIESSSSIAAQPKGKRKDSKAMGVCKEPELERRLLELFMEARNTGRKINKRWFVRQGRQVYGQLYPHRVTKASGRMTEYADFKSLMVSFVDSDEGVV